MARGILRKLAALATGTALFALTACSASVPNPPADGKVQIVASISNWGEIAKEIGGSNVDVTNLISDPSKDPHSYEATVRDQLEVNNASLVIVNGAGYDDFALKLIGASKDANKGLNIYNTIGDASNSSANQHVWYNLLSVAKAADAIAKRLILIDAKNESSYITNEKNFLAGLELVTNKAAELGKVTSGYKFFATEPIANDLLQTAGFVNETPKAFTDAIENETDVSPAVMQQSIDLIQQHKIDYLVVNSQTENAQIQKLITAARDFDVRAVMISEILPLGQTYLQWMTATLTTLNPGQ